MHFSLHQSELQLIMQIQRHLFKIYERAVRLNCAHKIWKRVFNYLLLLAITLGVVFVGGETFVLMDNDKLSTCLKAAGIHINNDSLYQVRYRKGKTLENLPHKYKQTLLGDNRQCTIIENKNIVDSDILSVSFGYDQVAMFMRSGTRRRLNYTIVTIYLKQVSFLIEWLYNLDTLIVNQIVTNPNLVFLQQKVIIKFQSGLIVHSKQNLDLFAKAKLLGKVVVCYALISISTSLYIFGTIVAAPSVILWMLKICNRGLNAMFKLIPWIGMHVLVRNTSERMIINKSLMQICKAMISYFLFLYLLYYVSIIWVSQSIPSIHTVYGLQELLFGSMALFQFSAIVCMRSKSFIKYFPVFHSLLIITLLYYWEIRHFGLKRIALCWAFSISATVFVWMVIQFELPQVNQNQLRARATNYRSAFFPIFNMEWRKNMPDEWTLLMPLFGKEHFTASQLSLVEGDLSDLGLLLGNS